MISGPGARAAGRGARARCSTPRRRCKPQVREAEWVGNRRWNLTFKTGQVLALPQGDEQLGRRADVSFARLDGVNRLLGGKVAAFDMRAPDRIYMRVPGPRREAARRSTPQAAGSR